MSTSIAPPAEDVAVTSSSPTSPDPSPSVRVRARLGAPAWLAISALVLALLTAGACAFLWTKWQAAQTELFRRGSAEGVALQESRRLAAQAEAMAKDLQARLGVAEVRLSDMALQRTQLDELLRSASRSREETLVLDLESSLQLALQQAELTGSTQPLVLALQSAERRIARSTQPRLGPVQRALARDLERLRAASKVDLPALAARVDELARQVDELPMANALAPQAELPAPARPPLSRSAPGPRQGPRAPSVWDRLEAGWDDWSSRAWTAMTVRGSELVRVHRIDQPEAALLAPEQAFFLRENTKLRLLNARLALLSRQNEVALGDLRKVDGMFQRYYDLRARPVSAAREALRQLERDLAQAALPRPDETLAAMAAASGRQAGRP
jgi:uroporphyrin-III C-methyltransferase